MKKTVLFIPFMLTLAFSCSQKTNSDKALTEELNLSLQTEILDAWYPRSIDSVYGGFLSNFTFDWQPSGPQNKMIVTQTRHLWTLSEAAMFYQNDKYRETADHAFQFLQNKMWDKQYGGFYTTLNREGEPGTTNFGGAKMAYGNAFGIYALMAYYNLTKNEEALELAKQTFLWLEKYSHDPVYSGYFNNLERNGNPLSIARMEETPVERPEELPDYKRMSQKDQNTSIHVLEALTELYKVWPDGLVKTRLNEVFNLISEKIVTPKGYLTLFLERDFTPISFRDSTEEIIRQNLSTDHVSFGHDIETGFLLLEAAHSLYGKIDKKTLALAKKMVDHTIDNGWDEKKGGIYDRGYYFQGSDTITIMHNAKVWWSEAEAMNALLLMSKLFPDEPKYREYFDKQWEYIQTFQIDHKHKGWYSEGIDKSPEQVSAPKGSDWKINYHNFRTMRNCIKMLRGDHELTTTKN
ncbi:AGE family epimerase/isomerase [Maribellus comscasis]|nr:AGE family epimerase/isomerase [Maribellus comscasis]